MKAKEASRLSRAALTEELRVGNPRSLGRVPEVVRLVESSPHRFGELVRALSAQDSVVRMRAADAIEKLSARHPEYLEPFRECFFSEIALMEQAGVRWHLAQIFPRVARDRRDAAKIERILNEYLDDSSSIVRTNSMQALAECRRRDKMNPLPPG